MIVLSMREVEEYTTYDRYEVAPGVFSRVGEGRLTLSELQTQFRPVSVLARRIARPGERIEAPSRHAHDAFLPPCPAFERTTLLVAVRFRRIGQAALFAAVCLVVVVVCRHPCIYLSDTLITARTYDAFLPPCPAFEQTT